MSVVWTGHQHGSSYSKKAKNKWSACNCYISIFPTTDSLILFFVLFLSSPQNNMVWFFFLLFLCIVHNRLHVNIILHSCWMCCLECGMERWWENRQRQHWRKLKWRDSLIKISKTHSSALEWWNETKRNETKPDRVTQYTQPSTCIR